jgi:hypothetical protein
MHHQRRIFRRDASSDASDASALKGMLSKSMHFLKACF